MQMVGDGVLCNRIQADNPVIGLLDEVSVEVMLPELDNVSRWALREV
jgi:hypothetical protein